MWGSSMHSSSGALHLEDGRNVTGLAPGQRLSWSPQGDSNQCFLEVALGERAHWVFSNTLTLKTKMLHRNVEDCWGHLCALPGDQIPGCRSSASTLGDTMPASGDSEVYQRHRFTFNSGNEKHFPQGNEYMGFWKWPFSWVIHWNHFSVCYPTFPAMFLLHALSQFRVFIFYQGRSVHISNTQIFRTG